jgi:hypothetical protein
MKAPITRMRREAGIALLTTILLMLLMSSLLIGFVLLITEGQKMSGMNNDYTRAFYASEAGMEKITADLGTLFNKNYSPTAAQLATIAAQPPILSGIQYVQFDGTSGYRLDYPGEPGAPVATVTTIKSGTSPYQDMTALATPYTLTVTARTAQGTEVKLQRTTQTVGIPMYQFGVFCDNDCSFFPGPDFDFGGRLHTNGNLFLAAGATLKLSQKVTVVKDVVRTNLSNGFPTTTGSYNGTVNVTTGNGGFRALGYNEGSLVGTLGSAANTNWPAISQGYYNSNIINGAKPLNLGIVTLGTGTKPIDIIRRPTPVDAPVVTQQRFFAQASVQILLSDNPADIMNMPCVDSTTQPFELRKLAQTWAALQASGDPQITNLRGKLGVNLVPLAMSGAVSAAAYTPSSPTVPAGDGYWVANGVAISPGFLKIEIQTGGSMSLSPCGNWQDVTLEVLGLGYVGRNINPVPNVADTSLPLLPGGQQAAQAAIGCPEPFPNAIIRLERIRDNPGPANVAPCGVNGLGNIVYRSANDFWPNALFDTREGTLRDVSPAGTIGAAPAINYSTMVTPGGVMHYIELDAGNIAKWLAGTTPGNGHASFDTITAPNDYTVYVSDRRGNWVNGALLPGPWPPLSFTQNETGEYGFEDFINSASSTGCPNQAVEAAEDLDAAGAGVLFTYGQDPGQAMKPVQPPLYLGAGNTPWKGGYSPLPGVQNMGTVTSGAGANVFAPYPGCNVNNNPSGQTIWPGVYIIHANEARENPTFFFRRALKIVNGKILQTGPCPGSTGGTTINCGLTIAAENPVYLQGDFNANSGGNGWNDAHVATSIVADAVTLLSNNWNDVNSFSSPFSTGNRGAATTWYRAAIVAGKGISFAQPTGYATSQDFGTDGGVHNFLRYIENWGGQSLHYRGSLISLYYNRQAIGVFKCCNTVYSPPTRDYTFDTDFLQPQLLPPRTPLFRDVNTTGFTQLLLPQQ